MAELPPEAQAIIDEPNLGCFVTLMKDGSPQVTPLWVDHDGTNVIINTVEGHQKALNLDRDKRVALLVLDRSQAFRWVQVRGRVTSIVRGEEAIAHIHKMQKKYSGDPNREYPLREGEVRLKVTIRPDHVTSRGGGGRGEGGGREQRFAEGAEGNAGRGRPERANG
jgi:PPOX class probable F420-dependent enzyme